METHINNTSKKANSPTPLSAALQEERLPGSCPFQTRVCDCFWDPYLKNVIDRLERVQISAARFITGDYKSRHEGCDTNIFDDLDLPSIEETEATPMFRD